MNETTSTYCQTRFLVSSAGNVHRFTFTGKEKDEETGYGYFGARYMDHELMTMWLSVDPMSDKDSGNSYVYLLHKEKIQVG